MKYYQYLYLQIGLLRDIWRFYQYLLHIINVTKFFIQSVKLEIIYSFEKQEWHSFFLDGVDILLYHVTYTWSPHRINICIKNRFIKQVYFMTNLMIVILHHKYLYFYIFDSIWDLCAYQKIDNYIYIFERR